MRYFFANKNMFYIDIPKMITFTCRKDGKHEVSIKDAKDVNYQYAPTGAVIARGVCPKHGGKLVIFASKDKVPAGEKIRAASPSTKKSHKKSGGKRKSKKSHPSHKKSHSSHKKSHKSHKRSAKK